MSATLSLTTDKTETPPFVFTKSISKTSETLNLSSPFVENLSAFAITSTFNWSIVNSYPESFANPVSFKTAIGISISLSFVAVIISVKKFPLILNFAFSKLKNLRTSSSPILNALLPPTSETKFSSTFADWFLLFFAPWLNLHIIAFAKNFTPFVNLALSSLLFPRKLKFKNSSVIEFEKASPSAI